MFKQWEKKAAEIFFGQKEGITRSKGFTLIELLIAIVILGILAAMVVPRFTGATIQAKCNVERSNIATINTQVELYNVSTNFWPEFPALTSMMSSNTYFPDGPPRDPFSNQTAMGNYTLDMRGTPARMRVYTESHLANATAPHSDCSTLF